jgi:hypothetical protein
MMATTGGTASRSSPRSVLIRRPGEADYATSGKSGWVASYDLRIRRMRSPGYRRQGAL